MMIYASKLVNDVMAKQEMADMAIAGLSSEVRDAIALAEHFEKITPDAYVLPISWRMPEEAPDEHAFAAHGGFVPESARL